MHNDGKQRCQWVNLDKDFYREYHDEEWGVPVRDDQLMIEFLTLEAFQAGLSWEIILRKRENFRLAFDQFVVEKVARYDEQKVQELLGNAGIVRNQLKIRATINNAQRFLEVAAEHGSFCNYLWAFVDGKPQVNTWQRMGDIPASTELSDEIARNLKTMGFKFLGTTVMYAHMQAVGMVNDHEVSCYRYAELKDL